MRCFFSLSLSHGQDESKPYSFLAFGMGGRTCLGMNMAKAMMLVFLHRLIITYRSTFSFCCHKIPPAYPNIDWDSLKFVIRIACNWSNPIETRCKIHLSQVAWTWMQFLKQISKDPNFQILGTCWSRKLWGIITQSLYVLKTVNWNLFRWKVIDPDSRTEKWALFSRLKSGCPVHVTKISEDIASDSIHKEWEDFI